MSEEDLTNYKTCINNFDITKYVVLDKESNYWYSAEYVDEMLKKQDKEIERLNNIINELERYINEEYIYDELGMKIFDASKLQDKLQELKGSDKSDKS